MCVSQCRWMGCRGRCCPAPSLLLLPLMLLLLLPLTTPPYAQGVLHIPSEYNVTNMSQPPVLTETPSSFTAFSAEDFYLLCEASGNPTPTFRWVKDGEVFGPQLKNTGTLRAEEDEPLDSYDGFYRCYASNTLGTAMTQTIQVIVEPQPVLLKQQRVVKHGYEGDSMVLTCDPPQSSTPPNIHWMDKRMVHIRQNDRVMVGLDGNLYFANLVKSDSRGDYICNAQYAAARTILPDTAVSLTVMSSNDVIHGRKPHLFHPTSSHTTVNALRGQSVTLECIPKGLPTPKVEWKKKDSSLEETSGQLENSDRWLSFDSITQSDDGEYECRAFNSHGSVAHSFTVTVEAAPHWVKEPQNLLYSHGETVRLDCQAEGIPTPTISWSINGQPVTEVDEDPRRSVSGGVLILKDVVFADTAVYQCEATNKHGSILVNSFVYVIELLPQILSSDGVVYRVVEGKDVWMNCDAFGSPRPHVTWEGDTSVPLLSDPRVSLLTNGTMELSGVGHEDRGTYTCSVKDTNISINAHLEVYNRTMIVTPPQDLHVLRGNSAVLDCHFLKDSRLHRPQVVWRKNGQKLQESGLEHAHGHRYTFSTNGSLKIKDVQTDDTASYSCEVITDLDNVQDRGSITVIAQPDPPKDLSLNEVEDQSLTLSWIPGQSHNSPITEYIVEAREEQHTDESKWKWEEWKKVPGDFNHLQLTLRPFCTYRFRVVAVNKIGPSEPSAMSDTYSTSPAAPDTNPTNVRSESTDPKSLIITWDELDKHFHNGQDFQYRVSWREAEGDSVHWHESYVKSPPLTVKNTGTFTPFEIKVQAVNSIGEGPRPEPKFGYSGEDEPEEAPSGVETTVINSSVRVKWNEAQNVRGELLGYKIFVRWLGPQVGRGRRSLGHQHHGEDREDSKDRTEGGTDRDRVVVVHGRKTSEEVTGLKLFSRYQVSVAVFNSKGAGPRSPPHHFTTPEGVPGPPASLTSDSPTDRSLVLFWTPPLEANGILLGYMVQYQQDVDSRASHLQMEFISDPSVTHIQLDELDPSSHYFFKVIARTAAGDGPPAVLRGATLLDGVPPSNVTIVEGKTSLNLTWVPGERDRNHGFHVRYLRKSAGGEWEESELVNSTQGFFMLPGLQPGTEYHLMILHGNETQWEEVVRTVGSGPSVMPGGFAAQGWLIGLISAIVLLVLILLILCLIKRSRGGKYAVKDKEDKEVDSEARPMKDETFGEYSDGDEKRSDSQPSLCGESKLGSDDSLAEYGDSVDIQFNEDGSFIGQYSGRGPVPHGNESSGPASPVTATAPPPPIAPSMSSVLNRPS
ncbi:neural cell adhesion molecule L1-like isoform X2 [Solea senegalensis]|uniref:Neural cell adhesion molecule L1 n=1 Tax=Solea senegalensis TaxID=28829 RepID=A0AAV6SVJ0_SOLSE|nr:neural cell adhesion molecule L1.1-like isoform X2 [Solea senegalensis]KAG7521394.1 neural cell adhesion molecule L1-like isoform X2 [Solea senegalensis]